MHPNWYYERFDDVFAWSRDYRDEISRIASLVQLRDRVVEEIGSGTGNHAAHIIEYAPRQLTLVDCDANAIARLNTRFGPAVEIIHGDGFLREESADVIIAMYCILQNTDNPRDALRRLSSLCQRVRRDCSTAVIEIMNTEEHLKLVPNGKTSTIVNSGELRLELRTTRTAAGVMFLYSGFFRGEATRYEVPLVRLSIHDAAVTAERNGVVMNRWELDSVRRRFLLVLSARNAR
ncbi:MAG: class I SAM-dependent methyltransferase [Thermoanaerobaculia bacterium]